MLGGTFSNEATLSGAGGERTLVLPASVDAISIGGDTGSVGQVIAKNETTNILEWDSVDDLSIPDHSIAGVKFKTDITFSTTGDIITTSPGEMDCFVSRATHSYNCPSGTSTFGTASITTGHIPTINSVITLNMTNTGAGSNSSIRGNTHDNTACFNLDLSDSSNVLGQDDITHKEITFYEKLQGTNGIGGGQSFVVDSTDGNVGITGNIVVLAGIGGTQKFFVQASSGNIATSGNCNISGECDSKEMLFYDKLQGTNGDGGGQSFVVDATDGNVGITGNIVVLAGIGGLQKFFVEATSGNIATSGNCSVIGDVEFSKDLQAKTTAAKIKGYGAGNETECSYLDLRSATNLMPTSGKIHLYDPTTTTSFDVTNNDSWMAMVGTDDFTDITFTTSGTSMLFDIKFIVIMSNSDTQLAFRYIDTDDSSVIDYTTRRVMDTLTTVNPTGIFKLVSFSGYMGNLTADTSYTLRPQFLVEADDPTYKATFYVGGGGDNVSSQSNFPPFYQRVYPATNLSLNVENP